MAIASLAATLTLLIVSRPSAPYLLPFRIALPTRSPDNLPNLRRPLRHPLHTDVFTRKPVQHLNLLAPDIHALLPEPRRAGARLVVRGGLEDEREAARARVGEDMRKGRQSKLAAKQQK